jgi:NAD(P)-dependent dehydrogenase (short-subunit alcohol dehydrogenase family)
VIFIGSVHGHASVPRFGPYAAAKGGLEGLTRQLAIELAARQTTVNCVAPGVVEVESYFRDIPNYRREVIAAMVPIGRVGFPPDIAAMVAYLVSDQAGFLTGQSIVIDGGQLARLGLQGI